MPAVQRLQFFLSESAWDPEPVNARRLELLRADPATAPHGGGVLVIDDSGDRKDGTATAHVGRQWLGRLGKTDNGIVTVTTVWADERVYYPVHARAVHPRPALRQGEERPGLPHETAARRRPRAPGAEAGFAFRAVAADCAYGDQDGFRAELARPAAVRDGAQAAPGHLGPRPPMRTPPWTRPAPDLARADDPGDWTPVTGLPRRAHRDLVGRRRDAGRLGTRRRRRLVVATTDPATLPEKATWYLVTNLPRPGGPRETPARTRPPTWPKSCASTASATGSSRATSRSRTNWAGPTSRSAPTSPSAATRPWSTARSPSAGRLVRYHPPQHRSGVLRPQPGRGERGAARVVPPPPPSWPRALRAVRAWLTPSIALQRWWTAWSKAPPR